MTPLPAALFRRTAPLLLLAAAGFGLGGCQVNQDTYDSLLNGYNALKARNVELNDENAALRATIDDMRGRMGSGSDAAAEALRMNAELRAQLAEQMRKYGDLEAKLNSIDFRPVALDAQTDSALQELAARFPNLLTYDQARGMLRFTSDVTFNSGDFSLSDAGRQAVREFARVILQTPAATQYEITVVGHTDTQRVTIRENRPFRNNAELSAFRALSVRDEMVAGGLEPWRVEFAGYGETRPAVQNNANGNTPQNRRVEVYLRRGGYNGLTANPVASVRPANTGSRSTTAPTSPATPATPGRSTTPANTPSPAPAGGPDIEIAK